MTREEGILEQIEIPRVQPRRYWLVRTDGGKHYEDFTASNYIALGWDFISREIFKAKSEEDIKSLIFSQEKTDPTEDEDDGEDELPREITSRVTQIFNKLNRFIIEIKIGDVVIIPSRNTSQISIGIVESDVYEDTNYVENYLKENPTTEMVLCPYRKRRGVNWLRTIRKEKIDVYLAKAFASHHALSEIGDYADYINRELYAIYQSGGMVHSTIRAGHPRGVSFQELRDLLDVLDETFKKSSEISGIEYDASKLQMKLNIHSPGLIEIVAPILCGGVVITMAMFAWNHICNGGSTKFNIKIGDDIQVSSESESPGIEGRRNERLKIENEYKVKVLELAGEQKLRELSETLEIKIPEIKTYDDTLTIDGDDSNGCK